MINEERFFLLRFAELSMRKARKEASQGELDEMNKILLVLRMSEEEAVKRAQAEVEGRY